MNYLRTILAVPILLLSIAGPAMAETWDAPGNSGIQNFRIGNSTEQLLVDFDYETTTGLPTWQGAFAPDSTTHFDGTTFTARCGRPFGGAYRAPIVTTGVKPLSIRFFTTLTGDMAEGAHAVRRLDGEATQTLTRTVIQTGRPLPNPLKSYIPNGWYVVPAELGEGYGWEVQGDTAFFTIFTYDANCRPDWYISTGAMLTATRYEGRLQHYSKASGTPVATDVGAITIATFYQNGDTRHPRMTVTLPNGTAHVLEPYTR